MKDLMNSLGESLAASPVRVQVQLPGGKQLGAVNADVRLIFKDRMSLVALAMGEIGKVGAAIVASRFVVAEVPPRARGRPYAPADGRGRSAAQSQSN